MSCDLVCATRAQTPKYAGVPSIKMNFATLVRRARDLHVRGKVAGCTEELVDEVYGRLCTSETDRPPEKLTTTRGRRTVFIFGPDAITSIILKMDAYDAILELGFTRAYVYHEVSPTP